MRWVVVGLTLLCGCVAPRPEPEPGPNAADYLATSQCAAQVVYREVCRPGGNLRGAQGIVALADANCTGNIDAKIIRSGRYSTVTYRQQMLHDQFASEWLATVADLRGQIAAGNRATACGAFSGP